MTRRKLYGWWITAFVLKSIGSFDISYHFKYLREFYQLPHVVNGVGNFLVIGLFIFMWMREPKKERDDLKIILLGIAVFCFGVVFDQWYHSAFGVDLTIWSPSHITLYVGTGIAILGIMLQVLRDRRRGLITSKFSKICLLALSFFILDSFWFLLLQQEQGVIASYLFDQGTPVASKELLLYLHNPQLTISGGLPAWLYVTWASLSATFVFTFIKQFKLGKFSATTVSGVYLIFRIVMNVVYSAASFPTSTMPYNLLLAAVVFDIAYFYLDKPNPGLAIKAGALGALVTLSIYSIGFINVVPPIHPAMPLDAMGYAFAAAFLAYLSAAPFRKALPVLEDLL